MGYPDDERSANDPMHNAETGLPELAITIFIRVPAIGINGGFLALFAQ